jgi:hypothetical protein
MDPRTPPPINHKQTNHSPGQRILLVTHSNAALNDLFEKILARDVDPRHLLRLGALFVFFPGFAVCLVSCVWCGVDAMASYVHGDDDGQLSLSPHKS